MFLWSWHLKIITDWNLWWWWWWWCSWTTYSFVQHIWAALYLWSSNAERRVGKFKPLLRFLSGQTRCLLHLLKLVCKLQEKWEKKQAKLKNACIILTYFSFILQGKINSISFTMMTWQKAPVEVKTKQKQYTWIQDKTIHPMRKRQ